MNQTDVNSAIARASRLMTEGAMQYMDNKAAAFRGSNIKGKGSSDLALLEQQAFGYSSHGAPVQSMQEKQQKRELTNQTLMESFAQTPPISGDNFPSPQNFHPGSNLITEQRIPQQQSYVQQPQYVQPTQYMAQPSIDYNMIKYLINEAIKENLETIKKSLINENSLKAVYMPGGNKIQFLDKSGNVYEGELKRKVKK